MHREMLALEDHRLVAPGAPHDLDSFLKAARALLIVEPKLLKLVRPITDGDAEDDASVRDLVDHRHLFGDVERMVQRQDRDIGAETQPRRACGERRKGDHRLRRIDPLAREAMVADGAEIEAEILGQFANLISPLPTRPPAAVFGLGGPRKAGERGDR